MHTSPWQGWGGPCDRTLLAPGLHSEQRGHESRSAVGTCGRTSVPGKLTNLPAHLGSRPEVPAEAAKQPRQSHAQEELPLCCHSPEVERPFGKFHKKSVFLTLLWLLLISDLHVLRASEGVLFFFNCLFKANGSCK